MLIHVVMRGQTVFWLARMYNTTVQAIVTTNELANPNALVVGQALVIPSDVYVVQVGDSLWRIARRFGVTVEQLARQNGIAANAVLAVGTRLTIPQPVKRAAQVLAFLEPRGDAISPYLLQHTAGVAAQLTNIALFSLEARRDGSLILPPANGLRQIVAQSGASIVLTVTNLQRGAFSGELAHDILQSVAVQNLLIENIVAFAEQVGNVTGVMFDFEHLLAADREAYVRFLQRARAVFVESGFVTSAALAPKTRANQPGEWFVAHDYRGVAAAVDFVLLMTYEWGYSAGPPMAVSPITEVEKVVQYALTEMPADKIMLGQNLYGYDWLLPFVQGGPYARAISPQMAIQIAQQQRAQIQYDERAQAPFFTYQASGQMHEVWFEDARSIEAKIQLIRRYNLRGIGYWKLGLSFPQNWRIIEKYVNVQKEN